MDTEDIGALWLRKSAKGNEYLSGIITIDEVAYKLIIFKNDRKTKDNQPDWRIYPQAPKPELNPNGTEKNPPSEEDAKGDGIPF